MAVATPTNAESEVGSYSIMRIVQAGQNPAEVLSKIMADGADAVLRFNPFFGAPTATLKTEATAAGAKYELVINRPPRKV